MKYIFNEIIFSFFSIIIKKHLPSKIIYDIHRNERYEKLYLNAIYSNNKVINIDSSSKYEFLNYLVKTKPIVLHGSSKNLGIIHPRTLYKNNKLLFASKNVLHSLGFTFRNNNIISKDPVYTGAFIIENESYMPSFISIVNSSKTSKGIIYILPEDTFVKTVSTSRIAKLTNNRIRNIHSLEWISYEPVKPLAKVFINIDDLPFKISFHRKKEPYILAIINYKKRCNIKYSK